MKAIILAAGTGSRLHPYTKNTPKALVPLKGKPLLEYQLAQLRSQQINKIGIVTGYLAEQFKSYEIPLFHNPLFNESNMLYSLMQAREFFDINEDLLICYGDIIYSEEVLKKLKKSSFPITVSADKEWLSLWSKRMDNPLEDAESFIYSTKTKAISELGQPLSSIKNAQAQYIGLIKIESKYIKQFCDEFDKLPASETQNMYMTTFIQHLIDVHIPVHASLHDRGWLEVDSCEDLHFYDSLNIDTLLK